MMTPRPRSVVRPSPGFTLVELLVVVTIVVILSVATLAAVLPSFNARRVSEGSRILQAALSRARDAAVRSNRPHGIRLLPDPADPSLPGVLTCSRIIEIEPGNDYDDGVLAVNGGKPAGFDSIPYYTGTSPPQSYPPPGDLGIVIDNTGMSGLLPGLFPYLVVREDRYTTITIPGSPPTSAFIPNPPTNWFFNLKQGEKIQINNSGHTYTIAGPIGDPARPAANPERLINFGQNYFVSPNLSASTNFSFLFLVNGNDDDHDGYVDEGFDGIDNDGDGIIDPGFNGIDDDGINGIDDPAELFLHSLGNGTFIYPGNPLGSATGNDPLGNPYLPVGAVSPASSFPNEFEHEVFITSPSAGTPTSLPYSVSRRPVPSAGAKETALPTNVVIDMTSWNSLSTPPERSVLPVDPATLYVDIMVAPNGQVIAMDANANSAPHVNRPFYHFWLTDIEDVTPPVWGTHAAANNDPRYAVPVANPSSGLSYVLAMPASTGSDPRGGGSATYPQPNQIPTTLKNDRRLMSINTRTGALTSTLVETFYVDNTQYPYEAAERGEKDVQP